MSSVFDFFISPTIDLEKKRQVLDDIAKSSALQPHTINFLSILVDVKRIDLMKEIVKGFETVQLESQHLAQVAKQVQRQTVLPLPLLFCNFLHCLSHCIKHENSIWVFNYG